MLKGGGATCGHVHQQRRQQMKQRCQVKSRTAAVVCVDHLEGTKEGREGDIPMALIDYTCNINRLYANNDVNVN